MQSLDLSLFKLTPLGVLDILLVAFIIYQLYNLVRGTIAVNILLGMGLLCALYVVVRLLHMQLLTDILGYFKDFGVIIIVVVFQQEIRRFLLLVGKTHRYSATRLGGFTFLAVLKTRKTTMPALSQL